MQFQDKCLDVQSEKKEQGTDKSAAWDLIRY